MKARFLSLAGVLIGLVVLPLRADTMTLTDGRVIQGHLNRVGDSYVIQPDHGAAFEIPVKELASIELGAPATAASRAKNAWRVAQYHIGRQSSLAAIIKLITAYQAEFPKSPMKAEVQAALMRYRQYQSLGFVRFSGQWMANADAKALTAKAAADADAALADYHAGKFAAAGPNAQAALKINPDNLDAMIILGALDYRAGNLPGAAALFSAVLARHRADVIADNDLAITLFHQRQQPRALIYFRKALNIDSTNRMLLDNIFIALNHYTGSQKTILFRTFSKLFNQADVAMQAQLAKVGLYRVGATWVGIAVYQQFAGQMAVYQKQKDALDGQYQSAKLYLQGVNQQLQQVTNQINQINTSIGYLEAAQGAMYLQTGYADLNNQALLSGYMSQLSEAQAQQATLQSQHIATMTSLRQMRLQAKLLEKSAPASAFRMHQRMMLPGDLTHVPPPEPLMVAGPALQLK